MQLEGAVAHCWEAGCPAQFDEEDQDFEEEFLSERDPSILHFLLASGDEVRGMLPSRYASCHLYTCMSAGLRSRASCCLLGRRSGFGSGCCRGVSA